MQARRAPPQEGSHHRKEDGEALVPNPFLPHSTPFPQLQNPPRHTAIPPEIGRISAPPFPVSARCIRRARATRNRPLWLSAYSIAYFPAFVTPPRRELALQKNLQNALRRRKAPPAEKRLRETVPLPDNQPEPADLLIHPASPKKIPARDKKCCFFCDTML